MHREIRDVPCPDYYAWSLRDIHGAYKDLFDTLPSRQNTVCSPLENLSYYHCKKLGVFSWTYDRLVHGSDLYPLQQFGTSQMAKPHPLRHSLACEERCRWMPVRSSAAIGRRAHLPLDVFDRRSICAGREGATGGTSLVAST